MIGELLALRPALWRLYDAYLAPVQAATGLKRTELDVLLFLAHHPGQDTAAQIVRSRGLSKGHVSAAVEGLARRGLLERRVPPENRREVRLSPTPAAGAIIALGEAAQGRFLRRLFRGISPADQAALKRILCALRANAADPGEEDAPC